MNGFFDAFSREIKSSLNKWKRFDWIFYLTCLTLLISSAIIFDSSRLSLLIACSSLTGAMLNAKMVKYCFIFYLFSTVMYTYVAFHNRFYGEFILYAFYLFPVYIYGLACWSRNAHKRFISKILDLRLRDWLILCGIGIVVTWGYGYILAKMGSLLPFVNSFATFACATAAYLAAKKIKQQWIFWLLYSMAGVFIWMTTLDNGTAQLPLLFVNMIFIVVNIIGYRNWIIMQKHLS